MNQTSMEQTSLNQPSVNAGVAGPALPAAPESSLSLEIGRAGVLPPCAPAGTRALNDQDIYFDRERTEIDRYRFEMEQNSTRFETVEDELRFFKARVYQLEHELRLVSNKGKLISQELDLFRQRRVVFWSDRFRNNFDAWNLMNASFQQLKDDSSIFHGDIHKFRLQPSLSLLRVPFLNYNFRLGRPGLRGVLLAPVLDVPLQVGELCVRLFSAPDTLVASCTRPVKDMNCEEPVTFDFDPIAESDRMELKMRVYVQGVDAPVRIFELRRYSLGGFGRLKSRPFAGFVF